MRCKVSGSTFQRNGDSECGNILVHGLHPNWPCVPKESHGHVGAAVLEVGGETSDVRDGVNSS